MKYSANQDGTTTTPNATTAQPSAGTSENRASTLAKTGDDPATAAYALAAALGSLALAAFAVRRLKVRG